MTATATRCPACLLRPKEKGWHLLCPSCWAETPKPLQDEIWSQYQHRPGAAAHLIAIREVLRWHHAKQPRAQQS